MASSRQRAPLAPDFNRSPSLLAGMNSRPEYRGKTAAELNATVPVFGSWEQAIASPYFASMDDRTKTMWLQELYGMGHDLKVERGRLVSDDHSLRNGLLGGAAMIGGLSGLDALIGGGTAAAAGGTSAATTGGLLPATTIPAATGTLTTGAVAAPATAGAVGAAGGWVPGAVGSATGAPSSGGGVGSDLLARLRGADGAQALAALLPLLAMGARGGNTGTSAAMPAGLTEMLNMSVDRAKRTDPLHQSITQLAMSRLPTNMQR